MPGPDNDLVTRIATQVAVLHADPAVRAGLTADLVALAESHRDAIAARGTAPLTAGSSYLITYGDSFVRPGEAPLATLRTIVDGVIGDAISTIHLLPMFPWTSDDGFAVVDYRAVNPALGTWDDIARLGEHHGLMFDFVANHVSASSPWFHGWLAGDGRYAGYFFSPGPDFDTSRVVRPRTTPLVHEYPRPDGTVATAWTTFSADQVDVNVATPAVLLDLTDVLLGYIAAGADTVRLDAIGFLWKESGTTCLHRPATHAVIKIWRAILDEIAPGARLLTETNVPHADNVSYFGNGADEAHMVYQFSLPPLVLHSFATGDASRLSDWAAGLEDLGTTATWFNFLASHDGIGMRPVVGLLTPSERQALVDLVVSHGGRASYATEPDGSRSVYELNVSYLDALMDPEHSGDSHHAVTRALAAHAILLSMIGVPAIYYHSLFGSSHDIVGMESSGINRRINRKQLEADALLAELDISPRRRDIFAGLTRMLRVRALQPAFDPFSPQRVLDLGPAIFAVRRGAGPGSVVAVINVSGADAEVAGVSGTDLLTGTRHEARLTLPADGVVWLAQD
ncbi:MAG: alpha-amylase [Actinobacteria bacterium HGW-Actinobacteria-8]|nr:MAG: alpha-amylase [Actinobacteria bacterium HGW-Actinobacteria-8]